MPLGGCAIAPRIVTFDGLRPDGDHFALVFTPFDTPPLVRVHSSCVTGDVLGSARCDCGAQLEEALGRLGRDGGVLLYLDQEGRGVGLAKKVRAYALQEAGLDTFAANVAQGLPEDARDYTPAAQMLLALGIGRIRLLTNSPDKATALRALGIGVEEMVPTGLFVTAHNLAYLSAKAEKAGHRLSLPRRVAARSSTSVTEDSNDV